MIEFNLLTYGGVAALIALVVQLLVKPALRSKEDAAWHGLAVNVVAVLLGIGASFVGAVIAETAWTASIIAQTAVTGLGGGLLAIGGYEGVNNIIGTVRPSGSGE